MQNQRRRRGRAQRQVRGGPLALSLHRSHPGLPERQVLTFGYADCKQITAGAGAANGNLYRLNSLFDPDLSGVGSQPIMHDQMAALYGRYRVLYADVELVAHNNNSVDSLVTLIGKNDSTNTTTTTQHLADSVNPDAVSAWSFTSCEPVKLAKRFWPWQIAGCKSLEEYRGDSQYESQFGSSPSATINAGITFSFPAAATATQCTYFIRVFYVAEVFDRTQQALN